MKISFPFLIHYIDDISIYLFLKIKYRLFNFFDQYCKHSSSDSDTIHLF